MLNEPLNPNGRPNFDVVRRFANGLDIVRRPQNKWIIDFGVDTPIEESALYEAPFQYVEKVVRPTRVNHRERVQAEKWWLLARQSPDMREAIASLNRYIGTARVAKYRMFIWMEPDVLPDGQIVVFAREDDYFFGVLHSRAHEVWSLRMGTWLGKGNDPRYKVSTSFETFPLPWPPGDEPVEDPRVHAIAAAAKSLDHLRQRWLNPADAGEAELKKRTLTNLYNARPTWLDNAHAALDRAVWDAYGWDDPDPATVAEDVILRRLLALNQERSDAG
jgi:hypothetical protein